MIMKRSSWNLFAHSLSLSWISFPRQKALPHSLAHLKTTATDSCRHFIHFDLFNLFIWLQSLCMQFTLFYLQLQLIKYQLNSADTGTTNLFQLKITKSPVTKSPNLRLRPLNKCFISANHQITKGREEKRQNQWSMQIARSTWLPLDPRFNKMCQLHHLSVISPETSGVDFGYHWISCSCSTALTVLMHVCDASTTASTKACLYWRGAWRLPPLHCFNHL